MYFLRKLIGDPDVALDLGTANTRLFANGIGLVADEPSVVHFSVKTPTAHEIGLDVSPLRGGVVVDVDAAASLLRPLLQRARKYGLLHPRAIACIPSDASARERKLLHQAAHRAGISSVYLAPEPLAAAIGSGLDIASEHAQMIVDIGDGVTDIAVIRSGDLLATAAVRKACSDLHDAARRMLRDQYRLSVTKKSAERLTLEFGAMSNNGSDPSIQINGTHLYTGRPAQATVSTTRLALAFQPVLHVILQTVSRFLSDLPTKTAVDIYDNGIHLTGGGACLGNLAGLIAQRTGVAVHVAPDPLHAVINGARQMLVTGIQTSLWQ